MYASAGPSDGAGSLGRAGYEKKMALYAKVNAMRSDDGNGEVEEEERVVRPKCRARPAPAGETAAAKRAKTAEESAAQNKLSELQGQIRAKEEERAREEAEYAAQAAEHEQEYERLKQQLKEMGEQKDAAITERQREVDGLRSTLKEGQETQRREEAKREVAEAQNKLAEFKRAREDRETALKVQADAFATAEREQQRELAALRQKLDEDAEVSSRSHLLCGWW